LNGDSDSGGAKLLHRLITFNTWLSQSIQVYHIQYMEERHSMVVSAWEIEKIKKNKWEK
jgi:hypothetical protein